MVNYMVMDGSMEPKIRWQEMDILLMPEPIHRQETHQIQITGDFQDTWAEVILRYTIMAYRQPIQPRSILLT